MKLHLRQCCRVFIIVTIQLIFNVTIHGIIVFMRPKNKISANSFYYASTVLSLPQIRPYSKDVDFYY